MYCELVKKGYFLYKNEKYLTLDVTNVGNNNCLEIKLSSLQDLRWGL